MFNSSVSAASANSVCILAGLITSNLNCPVSVKPTCFKPADVNASADGKLGTSNCALTLPATVDEKFTADCPISEVDRPTLFFKKLVPPSVTLSTS